MPIARSLVPVFTLALVCASGASAEIYRWTDESGREHFVASLDQVPARHRAAASEGAGESRSKVNYHQDRRSSPRAPTPSAAQPPAAAQPDERACNALRQEIAAKERVIRTHERSVESNQLRADDITLSAFSRRRYEVRAEEEAGWLAKGEADLEEFREARRREGVAPGCLR